MIFVSMPITLPSGEVIASGNHDEDTLPKGAADVILSNPRWGRRLNDAEAQVATVAVNRIDKRSALNTIMRPVEPSNQADPVQSTTPDPTTIDLSGDDASIKAQLEPMSEQERDAQWQGADYEQMAGFLVERAGRERKDGWSAGSMGNMIEKHLGLQ